MHKTLFPFMLSVFNIMLTFTVINKQKKTVTDAHDIVTGSPQESHQIKYLTLVQNCDKYNDHKGLLHKLYVAVDLIFNLTTNIKPEDGLIMVPHVL